MVRLVIDGSRFSAIVGVVPESMPRLGFGLRTREPIAGHELVDAPLEMEAQLFIDLVVQAPARGGKSEDSPQALPEPVVVAMKVRHHPAGSAWRMAVATSVYRVHRASWEASCLRPDGVRR